MKHIQVKLAGLFIFFSLLFSSFIFFNIYLFLCSCCGFIKYNLGGNKVFKCNKCGVVMDRDINGDRGIFLRALLDGAVCV